ncbi:DMT family transporter [Haloimpatiens sp. FM7315]|uniref:DMT family transporter n=1 Tax=Haloimpatiens sp. FM7315 TaxID=3298609 RepID=UPI00370BB060
MKKVIKNKGIYADISLLFVAMLWGGGFVVVKDALDSITPYYMMTMRFGLSTVLMCIVFFRNLKGITKKDLIGGTVVGLFLFLGFAFQTVGLQYTTAGKQAFLTATYVVIVPFLYFAFTKKSPDKYSVAAAFLALFGISMLTLQGKFSMGLGDVLTLFCALFFAAQIIAIDLYTKTIKPIVLTVIQMAVATVLSFICALIFEPKMQALDLRGTFSIIYLGVFSTLIAFLIQNIAQKYTSSTHAAIILSLESFFGCLCAVIFLGDKLTNKMIIGCIMIFIAIITAETKLDFLKKFLRNKDENLQVNKNH